MTVEINLLVWNKNKGSFHPEIQIVSVTCILFISLKTPINIICTHKVKLSLVPTKILSTKFCGVLRIWKEHIMI